MNRKVSRVIPFRDGEATVTGRYVPATRGTRLDPPDSAEFELYTVTVDGKTEDITEAEYEDICERMVELCDEEDHDGAEREDRRDNELDR